MNRKNNIVDSLVNSAMCFYNRIYDPQMPITTHRSIIISCYANENVCVYVFMYVWYVQLFIVAATVPIVILLLVSIVVCVLLKNLLEANRFLPNRSYTRTNEYRRSVVTACIVMFHSVIATVRTICCLSLIVFYHIPSNKLQSFQSNVLCHLYWSINRYKWR